ncbi:MAG: TldD/PmbA family protein, partial [Candidatus Geothermincolales bacterium]
MVEEEVLFEAIAEAGRKGADFCDVFVEERTTYTLRLEEGKVQENVSGTEMGAGIRVLVGETAAYAYTNSLRRESILEAARAAASAARSGKGGSFSLGDVRRLSSPPTHPVMEEPGSVEREFKLELVSKVDSSARAAGAKVSHVVVVLGEGRQRVLIANSLGELAEDDRVRVRLVAQVVARDKGEAQTGTESPGILGGYELFRVHAPEEVGRKAAEQALVMLEARQAPTGPMPVVIANGTGGVLFHEACGHGLEADAVYKKASVFAGRLGEKVASELVFAYDDATLG